MHGITFDTRNSIDVPDRRAGNLPLTQRCAIVGKTSGVRIPGRRRQQALAAKQLEDRAVRQSQHLVPRTIRFKDLCSLAQGEVSGVIKRLHQYSGVRRRKAWIAGHVTAAQRLKWPVLHSRALFSYNGFS
ncbi:hypothetical protein D3C86_1733770 [compost metagenome]